jgi:hypothetical protein
MKKAENNKTVIHIVFENEDEKKLLDEIKKLTGFTVNKKAILDALKQFPMFVKKSDFLNKELINVNRHFEKTKLDNEILKLQIKRYESKS